MLVDCCISENLPRCAFRRQESRCNPSEWQLPFSAALIGTCTTSNEELVLKAQSEDGVKVPVMGTSVKNST